jgi:hypothetical protein
MTDLDGREERVDAMLRTSGPRLRAAVSRVAVTDFRRPRSRRRGWVIAFATVVVLIVGLVAIGTNRNDQSNGNDPSRLHWLLTDLPQGFELAVVSEPGSPSQTGPPGATTMVNVYATDKAPLGPTLSVRGSLGSPEQEIVPASDGVNFQETTVGDRRAAFADGELGQRLLYVEVNGHWAVLTSRNIDDSTLSKMAESAVRNADGTALIPAEGLLDDLTLVSPSDAPAALGFSGIGYGAGDGRSIGLQVYPSRPSSRANLGLQASFAATTVAGKNGFVGSYSIESSVPPFHAEILSWEQDGLDFQVTGFNVTAAEVRTAAESAQHASDAKWDELLRATGQSPTGSDQGSIQTVPAGTVPAEPAPAGTDPPFAGDVRDVVMDVTVAVPSPNEQIWSGTLPTGEAWSVDVTRVFDSIAMKPEVDGQPLGMSYGLLARSPGQEIGCCGPLSVITADSTATALRVTTHTGDRFIIQLHDLAGTDGLRIAAIALPNGSGPQAAELIDADGNVLQTLPGGS